MYLYFKRLFDITCSLIGIIILSPIFVSIGLLIKLESKGRIFYRHARIGKNGEVFLIYKFRTMNREINESSQKEYLKKVLDFNDPHFPRSVVRINDFDPRVTRIGRILRQTSIDEIPQLINILKGDMSFVGPRPALPFEYENFSLFEKKRLEIRPGNTGLWQISGRNKLSYEEMNKLDLEYIEKMSFMLDLKIILKTIPLILFAKADL